MHKVYLSSAIDVLFYTRARYSDVDTNADGLINSKINTIYRYPYGTTELTNEYVSSMKSHSQDMKSYIWGLQGDYGYTIAWQPDGSYKQIYRHKDSDDYKTYESLLYKIVVPISAGVQENAGLIAGVSTIGAMIAGTTTVTNGIKGTSDTNESLRYENSSTGNSSVGDMGNTTSPGAHGSIGNGTTDGYAPSGNASPGYISPSIPNSGYQGASGANGRTFKSSYDIPVDENGYTKSSLSLGQKVHKEYKINSFDNISKFKEYRLPSGKRIDYIDFDTKTIYELKPNNPTQIKLGIQQLQGYLEEVESFAGKGWKIVLDTY